MCNNITILLKSILNLLTKCNICDRVCNIQDMRFAYLEGDTIKIRFYCFSMQIYFSIKSGYCQQKKTKKIIPFFRAPFFGKKMAGVAEPML